MRRRILSVTGVALPAIAVAALPAIAVAAQPGIAVAAQPGIAVAAQPGIAVAAQPAASNATVSVRVEGVKKTRLLATEVSGRKGWITKGGTPKGKCSGHSAAGALDVATKGNWDGSWIAKYQALSISGILGERHGFSSPYYWSIWVNDKYASTGACGIPLKKGEQLLFAVEPEKGMWYPTVLSAPRSATANHSFKVKLMGYSGSGKKPLAGVAITGTGITASKTNHSGVATITDSHSGMLVLQASPAGYIRTEATVHVAS